MNVKVGGAAPTARGYHTAEFYDSRLWLFGGSAGQDVFAELHVLDLGVYGYLSIKSA